MEKRNLPVQLARLRAMNIDSVPDEGVVHLPVEIKSGKTGSSKLLIHNF